jgi:hypothetical protein
MGCIEAFFSGDIEHSGSDQIRKAKLGLFLQSAVKVIVRLSSV